MDRSHHPVSFLLYRLSPVVPLVLERGNVLRKKYARQRRSKRVPPPTLARTPASPSGAQYRERYEGARDRVS